MLHAVLFHQTRQNGDGLLLFLLGERGIDHGGIENAARAVHHGHFAAVAIAGVQAHGDLALDGGLEQQRFQIQRKIMDGSLVGRLRQGVSDFPLHGRLQQPVVGILRGSPDKGHGRRTGHHHGPEDGPQNLLPVRFHGNLQKFLFFAPVDGQNLVALQLIEGLGEVVVQAVDGVRILLGGLGPQLAPLHHLLAQDLADIGVIGNPFGNDIRRTGQGVFHRLHALLRVDVLCRQNLRGRGALFLVENGPGQGLQPLLPCHRGAGPALLLVGPVQILHLGQGLGGVDGGGQFFRQFSLGFNGRFDLPAPLLQIAEILEPLGQVPDGLVVHGPVHLLAVTGDKGNGVAHVQQGDNVFHMGKRLVQLLSQTLCDGLHRCSPLCDSAIILSYIL